MSRINIDEDSLKEAPSFATRLKHAAIAIFLSALIAQGIAFILGFHSIVLWYDSLPFILFASICGILGFVVGERFIETLILKITDR